MKTAGWLSIVVAAILLVVVMSGMRDDALQAASPHGRDLSEVDSNNSAWMVEGIAGAAFLIAGVAMVGVGNQRKRI
jgi:hypothetical protein